MKSFPSLFLFAVIIGSAFAQEKPAPGDGPVTVVPSDKSKFRIYLLMGQSNMAGRDARAIPPPLNNPQVLSLSKSGEWILAREPLHPESGKIEAGVGPGIFFALERLKMDPGATIGLVSCAVGGTALSRWVKGGDLYEKAISRAKIAGESGTIVGVLWHQGESDSKKREDAETYETRLNQMFSDLRADLGLPDLPIVVGQLGEFVDRKRFPHVETVRQAIKNIPKTVSHVGFADSTGLGDKGDQLHFSADSEKEMGLRYAKAFEQLQK